MFRLPPIRLWRNCSLALFGLGACAALTGTVLVQGQLAIHFDSSGAPNGFAGKWVLWLLLAFRHAAVTSSDSRAIGLVGRCRLSVFLHHGILVASWSAAFFCIEESDTVIAAGIGDFIRSDGFRSHSSSSFCLLGFLFAVLLIVLGPISLLLLGHLRKEHEIVSRRFSGENGISCKSGCGKHSCGRYHDDVFLQVSHNESILSEANLYMHSVRVLGGAERKGFHDIGIIVSTKSNNGKRLLLGNQD